MVEHANYSYSCILSRIVIAFPWIFLSDSKYLIDLSREVFKLGKFKMSHKTCSDKCNRWPKPILLEGFCILKIMVFPAVLFHVHELFPGYDNDRNHLFSILPLVTARKLACNNTILSVYMYVLSVPILIFELLGIMPLEAITSSFFNIVCLAMTLWKMYRIVRQKWQ